MQSMSSPTNDQPQSLAELLGFEPSERMIKLFDGALDHEPIDHDEYQRRQVETYNARPGNLPGDCPICLNKGHMLRYRDGEQVRETCQCSLVRLSQQRLAKSGLAAVVDEYTMAAYEAAEPWQKAAKEMAERFIANHERQWLAMLGQPGSGKTHLCTAVAVSIMRKNSWELRYMPWRDDVARIKAVVTDDAAYQAMIAPLKTAKVLYVDDFFKTGQKTDPKTGQMVVEKPTSGDINVAFELLNHRYNNPNLVTILSSERSVDDILAIDEAIGSRIYERTKGFCLELGRDRAKNYRLKD